MIHRWRSLVRPDQAPHLASPNPAEAFGGWMLGTACALVCLWLGDLGTHSLIPGVLVCGALAILGWRHIEWLFWFPTMVVIATLGEPLAPLSERGRDAVVYVDVLVLGVLLVAFVRALALRRRVFPRTPVDLLLLGLLVAGAMPVAADPDRIAGLLQFKGLLVAVLVFYASAAVAGRPGGARWIWPAFPLALALVGLHALWASARGPAGLRADAAAADVVWHSREGLLVTLLLALPAALGLSMDAGHRVARRLWQAAAALGGAGIALHLWAGAGSSLRPAAMTPFGYDTVVLALAWIALAVIARRAWSLAEARPAETPRWVAVAFTCLAMPLLPLLGMPATGATGRFLVAIAGGLVVGTERALARDARAAGEADDAGEPPLARAA